MTDPENCLTTVGVQLAELPMKPPLVSSDI